MIDWKYILKRVIAGVLIGVILMALRGKLFLQVKANSISPYQWGGYSYTITSNTTNFNWNVPALPSGSQPWVNHENGILRFNLSINKLTGDSTQAFPMPRTIVATSGSQRFVCSFGNAQWQNSTFVGVTYSVECPMNLNANYGVDSILIAFNVTGMPVSNSYNMTISADASYEVYEGTSVNVTMDTSSTTNAINDQTTTITDNQDQNTQDIIDSNKVCSMIDNSSILNIGYLRNDGTVNDNTGWGITDYLSISSSSSIKVITATFGNSPSTCFYNVNKSLISCVINNNLSNGYTFTIPSNASFVKFSINKNENKPQFQVCKNGNQAIADGQQEINNSLNDSSVDTSGKDDYFTDFDDSNPLLNILLFPIELLQTANSTCTPITLTYLNQDIILPCGDTLFWNRQDVSSFRSWWNLFVGGCAIYFLAFKLFHVISDAVDPFKDDISKVGGF